MSSLGQSSSLQRLHNVEKRIVRVLELAVSVMEELGNAQGPRADAVAAHCREFMLSMKDPANCDSSAAHFTMDLLHYLAVIYDGVQHPILSVSFYLLYTIVRGVAGPLFFLR